MNAGENLNVKKLTAKPKPMIEESRKYSEVYFLLLSRRDINIFTRFSSRLLACYLRKVFSILSIDRRKRALNQAESYISSIQAR